MKKRLLALLLAAVMVFALAACNGNTASDGKGSVYYLNFKPE